MLNLGWFGRGRTSGAVATFCALALGLAATAGAQEISPKMPYYGSPTPCPQSFSQVVFTFPDWVCGPNAPGPSWCGTTRGRGGVAIVDQNNNVRTLNAREGAEGLGVSSVFDITYSAPGTPTGPDSPFARKILRLTQAGQTIDFGNVIYDMQGVEGGWEMNIAIRPVGSEIYFTYPGWAVSEASPGPVWLANPSGKGGIGKIDFFGYVSSVLPDMGNIEGMTFDKDGNLYFAVPVPGPRLARKVFKLHADGYLLDLGKVIEEMSGVVGGWSMKLAAGPGGEVYFNYPGWALSVASPGPSWLPSPSGSGGIGVIRPDGEISAFFPNMNNIEGIAVNDAGVIYFARSADGAVNDRTIWKKPPDSAIASKVKDVVTGMAGVRYGWSMDVALVQCTTTFPTLTPQPTFAGSPTMSKTPTPSMTPSFTPSPTPYLNPCDARAGEVSFSLNPAAQEYGGFSRKKIANGAISNVLSNAPLMGLVFDRSGDNYFVTNAGMPELMSLKFDGSFNYLGALWGSTGVKPGWTVSLAVGADNALYYSRSIYADGGPGIGKWVDGVSADVLSGVTVECMDFDANGNLYFITDKLEADLVKRAPNGEATTVARLWSAASSADWWRPSIAVRGDGLVYFTMSPFTAAEAGQAAPGGVFSCNPANGAIAQAADVPYAIALDIDQSGAVYIGHGQNDRLDLAILPPAAALVEIGNLYIAGAKQANWAPDIAVFSCGPYFTPIPTLSPTASISPTPSPTPSATPELTGTPTEPATPTPSYSPTLTDTPTPPPTATPGMCAAGPDEALLHGYLVQFLGAVYDPGGNATTFSYRLTGQGEPPQISHWALALGPCEVESATPQPYNIGKDPTTNLTGIKWEQSIGLNDSRDFSLTIAGEVPVGTVEVAVKGGSSFEGGHIAGPRCDCGGASQPAGGAAAMMGESFNEGGNMGGAWQGGAMIIEPGGQVQMLSDASAMPSATVQLDGLCLSVPAAGDNIAAWWSQDGLVPLTDKTVYRVQLHISTDQTNPGAIPMFELIYDNFSGATGQGPSFGGTAWLLDAAGGANGIGRPGGREMFEVFFAPNAALAPQWRGLLGDGGGAFTPEADAQNDIRLVLRVLDMGSGGINAAFDQGTICVSSLRIDSFPMDSLPSLGTLYDPPISESHHAANALGQNPAYASIDEMSHVATYKLDSASDRATLLPADTSSPPADVYDMYELYPIPWQTDALYRVTARIQAAEPWGGNDPLDAIFINIDAATSEIGQMNFTSRGAQGFMPRAASPRRPSVAGGAQTYVAYFGGQNATAYADPAYRRLRPTVDLFNSPTLGGVGSGRDAVQILGLKVEKIQKP